MDSKHKYRLVAFVPCEAHIVDQSSKISLINMFQKISLHELPAYNTFWCYLSFISLDNDEHQIKITFKESLSSPEKDIFVHRFNKSPNLTHHYIQRVETNFKNYGDCFLYGYLDNELIGEIKVQVIHF